MPSSIARAFTPPTCAAIKQREALEFTEGLAGQLISNRVWEAIYIAVFVRVSGLLRHRIIRADLPIAGIPYNHAKSCVPPVAEDE